jgi:uncharacterized delta-60 repeat protein
LDTSFFPGSVTDGMIYCVALQADGRVVIGRDFGIADNGVRNRIARLRPDGLLDSSFGAAQSGADAAVRVVAVQNDGKILIAGDFNAINDLPRHRFARLKSDGSLDTDFAFTNIVQINAIVPQSDGRILVGGTFTKLNGLSREGIARLNQDGTLDTSFTNAAVYPANVYSIAVQPDGNIIVGGSFWKVGGVLRTNVARIQSDGRLDSTFGVDPGGPDARVNCVSLQADGKVLLGGQFATVNGVIHRGLARLNSDVSGRKFRSSF